MFYYVELNLFSQVLLVPSLMLALTMHHGNSVFDSQFKATRFQVINLSLTALSHNLFFLLQSTSRRRTF